jgi:glycosyltransferase involved in cell wall biosynthesis
VKLVFVTQVIDRGDAVLGFTSRWVRGFAQHCEAVRVIALEVGDTSDLPDNVDVRELGRKGRISRYLRYRSLLNEAFGDGFDAVLSHMVPRYAIHAHGPARKAGAREFLWYTHAGVDKRLLKAIDCVGRVFTATDESLRVDTPKRLVTGHGIDVEHFDAAGQLPADPPRLLSVGRLTPKKDPLTIIEALGRLRAEGRDVGLDLVGAGLVKSDESYARAVQQRIEDFRLSERVRLLGSVPYLEVPANYAAASIVVNSSLTGSLDKVTLEAMASRRPVISCNDTAPALFAELGDDADLCCFPAGDDAALADRIGRLLDRGPSGRGALGERLRQIVVRDHRTDDLMERLVHEMEAHGS